MTGRMLAAMALLVAAAAGPPSPRQAAYDAAQAAYDNGDWQTAADGFAALLPPGDAPLGGSSAVIGGRRALPLDRLGRTDEAEPLARRAIAGVPAADGADIASLWLVIGDAARNRLDFAAAVAAYGHAKSVAAAAHEDALRVTASGMIALAVATSDPARAEAEIAALLDDAALVKTLPPKLLASIEQMRARALLNRGDLANARIWIRRAVDHAGGSTSSRVRLSDVSLRGDAAIIAERGGHFEDAREFLAYSGAGHLKSVDWVGHAEGPLPVCGGEGEIAPNDFAVIELSIDDAGRVRSVIPVYASRPGAIGATFAKAVQGWRWPASAVAKVEPFWRTDLRLELRCETRPEPETLAAPFLHAVADGAVPPATMDAVRLYGAVSRSSGQGDPPRVVAARRADRFAAAVPAFVARYPDTAEAAWLRLEWALSLEAAGRFGPAAPLIEAVLATPRAVMDDDAPVRQVALLHRALIARRTGEGGTAMQAANATSCALVDTRPIPTNLSIVSSQFPSEAMRWHFEGNVRIAYDIGADGRPTGVRTIMAYPPFVFDEATEKAAAFFRYVPPLLDGKPIGCVGATQGVTYHIPDV